MQISEPMEAHILKVICTLTALLFMTLGAQAQTNPLGSGYSFANGTLFVPAISVLKNLVPPFGYAYNFSATATPSSVDMNFLNSAPLSTNVGFVSGYVTGQGDTYHFKNYLPNAANAQGTNCNQPSCSIYRWPSPFLANGNIHSVCMSWSPQGLGALYIDGYWKDSTYINATFVPSLDTSWQVGQNATSDMKMYDLRIYNRALTPADCVNLANNTKNGVYPTSGSLSTGMVLHLPLDNCTVNTGVWSCADTSGNGNIASTGNLPPATVAVTAPSAGTISGDVTMTATCTLVVGSCLQVCYYVDGNMISNKLLTVTGTAAGTSSRVRLTVSDVLQSATGDTVIVAGVGGTTEANGTHAINVIDSTHIDLVGTTFSNAYTSGGTVNDVSQLCPTVAPYTLTWATASQLIDGSHSLTAKGFDVDNTATASAAVAVTASNGTVAKNYYFSPAGNDSNTCLSMAQACKTFAKMATFKFLGGDTVNFDGSNTANTFTNTSGFVLCGAGALTSPIVCTQNYYGNSSRLTFTSYNAGTCNPFSATLPTKASPSAFALPSNCAVLQRTGGSGSSMFQLYDASNVTVQNLSIIGPNTSSCSQFSVAVGSGAAVETATSLTPFTGVSNLTIQNILGYGWGCTITINSPWGNNLPVSNQLNTGSTTNVSILDNVISSPFGVGTSLSTTDGIRLGPKTLATVQGNLITNMGGDGGNGGSITTLTYPNPTGGSTPTLIQFNVSHETGGNYHGQAGGPYAFLSFTSEYVNWQFNEQYTQRCWYSPGWPACMSDYNGVDDGGIDMDGGTTTATIQYNYFHDNPQVANPDTGFVAAGFALLWCTAVFTNDANQHWGSNVARYNIFENNAQAMGGAACTGIPTIFPMFNNNTIVGAGSRASGSIGGGTVGQCWEIKGFIYNNLCIQTANTGTAAFATWNGTGCPATNVMDYNYYWGAGTASYGWSKAFAAPITTLLGWQTVIQANSGCSTHIWDQHSFGQPGVANPLLTGTPGTLGTCYSDVTATIPTGPQACNASNPYRLQHGSPLIGVGVDVNSLVSQYTNSTRDYFGNTVPHSTGSGWNIGADGGAHP